MKSTIRIPTNQFAYIEVEFDGTEQEVIDKHNELTELYKLSRSPETPSSESLEEKDMNKVVDGYMAVLTMPSETYESLGKDKIYSQQDVLQILKRHYKRIAPKELRT